MSATVAARRVADAFLGEDLGPQTLYHGHSFGGTPWRPPWPCATWSLLQEWDVLANVRGPVGTTGPSPGRR